MSFKSETYLVLIASPSDLVEERQAAVQAINDWNAQHAVAESVVLLPVLSETYTVPQSGVRPQEAINRQLVRKCDILVGMFWTKVGTDTGVAESGTIEEINRFVSAGKPVMLYVSSRPIDPNKIDLKQYKKLKTFKNATYKKALIGGFGGIDELRQTLLRDLIRQVRELKERRPSSRVGKLDQAFQITKLMRIHRQHEIAPEEYQKFRDEVIGLRRRSNAGTSDPVRPGEVGPNGYRVGYTKAGDKVEWIPGDRRTALTNTGYVAQWVSNEKHPGEWPMLLRRNDKSILKAYNKFWDKVWWNDHQDWLRRIKSGEEPLSEEEKPFLREGNKTARRIERKNGKRNLRWDDFELGLLSGQMSALAWVMGAEWEESLDT